MVTFETEIDVICAVCSKDMDVEYDSKGRLNVQPCESCLKDEKLESYDEGYKAYKEEEE